MGLRQAKDELEQMREDLRAKEAELATTRAQLEARLMSRCSRVRGFGRGLLVAMVGSLRLKGGRGSIFGVKCLGYKRGCCKVC